MNAPPAGLPYHSECKNGSAGNEASIGKRGCDQGVLKGLTKVF